MARTPANWRSSAGIRATRLIRSARFAQNLGYIMGRVRSLLTRFIKPAAMVGTVGILSFGLVVTTPSNAHALVTYPKIPPAATFIMGATKTVAPAAMAAASFTPVGLGLRLAYLAFSTADLWVPLVTQTFGNPRTEEENTSADGYRILAGFRLTGQTYTAPNRIAYSWSYSGGGSINKSWNISTFFSCRQTATGNTTRAVGTVFDNGAIFSGSANSSTPTGTTAPGRVCPDGSEIISGSAGPTKNTTVLNGPENTIYYGGGIGGFDPRGADVGYQGRSECIDSQGTISWAEGPITPGDNNGGTMLMPSCEKAGKGHGTGRTQVKGFKPDGTTETVWDTGTNPLSDPATPLCDPGRTSSGCLMEVTKDGQPCVVGDVECENWASESKKEPNTRYGCKLGPYTLPASACSLLEGAYVPGGSPLNDPNTDGNPDTRSPLGPDASAPPVSAPAPVIAPAPAGGPGASGNPGAGADEKTRNCFPTGWAAFNPIEWILKPIRCAFEPSMDVTTRVQTLRDTAKTKAPISWLQTDIVGPGGGGCPNWTIHVGGADWSAVCGSSFTAAIVSSRGAIFAMLSVAMVWPLLRSLWYAAIPILRVTPSSGGK